MDKIHSDANAFVETLSMLALGGDDLPHLVLWASFKSAWDSLQLLPGHFLALITHRWTSTTLRVSHQPDFFSSELSIGLSVRRIPLNKRGRRSLLVRSLAMRGITVTFAINSLNTSAFSQTGRRSRFAGALLARGISSHDVPEV